MATFNSMLVTNGGKLIYAKAMQGKSVVFNRVSFGSGTPESQSAAEALTQLVATAMDGAIESIDTTTTAGVAIVTVSVNNATLDYPVGIKEIGLFCKDPDTGASVMYAYCFSPSDIDVIPSNQNGVVTWKMRLQLAISNVSAGEAVPQTALVSFAPEVRATAADGVTAYVSQIVANGKYLAKNSLVTVMYDITGVLTNMENAETGLSSLTVSLPHAATANCTVCGRMSVTPATGETPILVDVTGEIATGSTNISIDYFGVTNGNFALLLTATYSI